MGWGQGFRIMKPSNAGFTPEEAAAGAFVFKFGFGDHAVKGRSVLEIWESSPKTLVQLIHWKGFAKWPDFHRLPIEQFMALPRIKAIADELYESIREAKAQHFKHKARERAAERDLLDRATEYGGVGAYGKTQSR